MTQAPQPTAPAPPAEAPAAGTYQARVMSLLDPSPDDWKPSAAFKDGFFNAVHLAAAIAAEVDAELAESEKWWLAKYDSALAERDAQRCRAEAAEAERDALRKLLASAEDEAQLWRQEAGSCGSGFRSTPELRAVWGSREANHAE